MKISIDNATSFDSPGTLEDYLKMNQLRNKMEWQIDTVLC